MAVKVLQFTRYFEGSIHRTASSAKAASLRRDDVLSLQLSSLPATLAVSRLPLLLANLHQLSYVTIAAQENYYFNLCSQIAEVA